MWVEVPAASQEGAADRSLQGGASPSGAGPKSTALTGGLFDLVNVFANVPPRDIEPVRLYPSVAVMLWSGVSGLLAVGEGVL